MKRKLLLGSFFMLLNSFLFSSQASWNIYMYMEAGACLHQAALQNLNDIARNKPDNVNIFILFHYAGDTATLYCIEKNTINILDKVPLGEYASEAFIPCVKKLEEENPAERHCVILWNHGYGILVPRYNQGTEEWEADTDTLDDDQCPIRACQRDQHEKHKGMLINMETKTCMGNKELVQLFKQLSEDVFHKKIDICGLDMCKGAMVEHGYQLRNYVDILIGSQECELADGWPYDLILPELQKNPFLQPQELAIAIIDAYKKYYQKHAPVGIYTQSALDLHHIEALKEQLDQIADQLIRLLNENEFKEILYSVRKQCRAFCDAPMYMDCYAFLHYLVDSLETFETDNDIAYLKEACKKGCGIITRMVIANAVGDAIASDVHGVSIYHPYKTIDESYLDVPFAQESLWLNYLNTYIA